MPASSKVEIANRALIALGQPTIAAFDDDSNEARAVNVSYETCRRYVLRHHIWNFAAKRSSLTQRATAPVFGWSFAFILPADCLRAVYLSDQTIPFRVEHGVDGRDLLTDNNTANLIYIADVEDTRMMDDGFVEALVYRLAWAICLRLTGSTEKQGQMSAFFVDAMNEARYTDALEGTLQSATAQRWLRAREAGDEFRAIESS